MKIEVLQIENEGKNEFEVKYNGMLKYKANLPFVSIKDPLSLEKIRSIKIFDTNNTEIYTTDYKYIENFKEQLIPMKFIVTGSQKFNQLIFTSNNNIIKIYYEENGIWDNRYVIEMNGKQYFCYSKEDGYIRHLPIYDGEVQIGEALKSNILKDDKDEYWCYLKKEYESLSDGVTALLLYLDRSEYSSSYIVNKSYTLEKKFSYNKTNKYYDKEWVKNNFGDEFYKKVDNDLVIFKEKMRHPIKTSKEMLNTVSNNSYKRILIIGLFFVIFIGVVIMIYFGFKVYNFFHPMSEEEGIETIEQLLHEHYNTNFKVNDISMSATSNGTITGVQHFDATVTDEFNCSFEAKYIILDNELLDHYHECIYSSKIESDINGILIKYSKYNIKPKFLYYSTNKYTGDSWIYNYNDYVNSDLFHVDLTISLDNIYFTDTDYRNILNLYEELKSRGFDFDIEFRKNNKYAYIDGKDEIDINVLKEKINNME